MSTFLKQNSVAAGAQVIFTDKLGLSASPVDDGRYSFHSTSVETARGVINDTPIRTLISKRSSVYKLLQTLGPEAELRRGHPTDSHRVSRASAKVSVSLFIKSLT